VEGNLLPRFALGPVYLGPIEDTKGGRSSDDSRSAL